MEKYQEMNASFRLSDWHISSSAKISQIRLGPEPAHAKLQSTA